MADGGNLRVSITVDAKEFHAALRRIRHDLKNLPPIHVDYDEPQRRKMVLSPAQIAALKAFGKTLLFSIVALAAGAAATFITNNGLQLDPTYSAVLVAVAVPILVALEQWANYEETQP